MTDITDEERAELRRRIDCPLAWCEGRWLDHGGDGAPPATWLHDDGHGIDLPHGASLHRSRVGSGPDEWSLALQGAGGRFSIPPATGARQYAELLRDIADRIEELAS